MNNRTARTSHVTGLVEIIIYVSDMSAQVGSAFSRRCCKARRRSEPFSSTATREPDYVGVAEADLPYETPA